MKKPTLFGLTMGLVLSASLPSLAASSRASCYLLNKEGQAIRGVNTNQRYEIASVSKIMTSLWALHVLGAEYRYETQIHVVVVGPELYDVHIQGAEDPFYNREQFQFLVTELNAIGIKKIRTLSFDENFKYLTSTRQSSVVTGHYSTRYPQIGVVESQLRTTVAKIGDSYPAVQRRGKEISEIVLPKTIELNVNEVKVMKSSDFRQSKTFASTEARHLIQRSVPLVALLKEMNRSSNNYAANVIFQSLGGADLFQDFVKEKLALGTDQIRFLNGSGDRHDFEDGSIGYNEATCQAVIATIATLKIEAGMQQLSIADIIAVAGADAPGEKSTVTSLYSNESTSGALVAKTGTVSPSVTLAGMASTEQGDVYFGYIYGADGSRADWTAARNSIRQDVVDLFRTFKKKKEIEYEADKFITFDSESPITEVKGKAPVVPDFDTDQVSRALRSGKIKVVKP